MSTTKSPTIMASTVVSTLALVLTGCGGSNDGSVSTEAQGDGETEQSWTGYTYTNQQDIHDLLQELVEETIPELTDGNVTGTMHTGGSLGVAASDIAQAVGDANVHFASDGFYHGSVRIAGVLALPMLHHDVEGIRHALEVSMPDIEEGFRDIGVEVVGYYIYPNQTVFTNTPVTSLDDLDGLKIRVSSPEQGELMKSLGASPQNIGTTDVPSALQQGVVDGVLTASSGGARSYPELLTHNYRLPINPVVSMLEINKESFDALPEDQQEAVRDAAVGVGEQITEILYGSEEDLTRQYEDDGMIVTEPTDDEIKRATEFAREYWDTWTNQQGATAERLVEVLSDN